MTRTLAHAWQADGISATLGGTAGSADHCICGPRFFCGNTKGSQPITIPLLERAFPKLPGSIREVRIRANAAFFDHDIVRFIEAKRAFLRYRGSAHPAVEKPPVGTDSIMAPAPSRR